MTEDYSQLIHHVEFDKILPEDVFPTFIASPKVLPFIDLEKNRIWKDASILLDESFPQSGSFLVKKSLKSIEIWGEKRSSSSSRLLVEIIDCISQVISSNWPGKILKILESLSF